MPYEEKRALIKLVLDGHSPSGKKYGVYVDVYEPEGKRGNRTFRFRIFGELVDVRGKAPMDASFYEFLADPDHQHGSLQDELIAQTPITKI